MKLRDIKFLQESFIFLPEIIYKFKSELQIGYMKKGTLSITEISMFSKQRTVHLLRRDTIISGCEILEQFVPVGLLEKAM